MRFPPPARYFIPLLVLIFGFTATWLGYELNLANDLARDLTAADDNADATGRRLARLTALLLPRKDYVALEGDLEASADAPALDIAAIIGADGVVIRDSSGELKGLPVAKTELAPAAKIDRSEPDGLIEHVDEASRIYGAYPVGDGGSWVALSFDRRPAMADARRDALRQLRWTSGAIAVLCLALWTGLHYGFAGRVAALARSVRDFDAEEAGVIAPLPGGDEVAELSGAFAAMAARVRAHEVERAAMERKVLQAGEEERRRIGSELHDGLGQRLTAAALAANSLADELTKTAPAEATRAAEVAGQIRTAVAEARQLSHGLAPAGLESGLGEALAALAASSARSSPVRVVFEGTMPAGLHDAEMAIHLFRIAQEAVNNALKHAGAREIRIGLESRDSALILEVEDDGDGLPEPLPPGRGIGLRIMRHRSELLGGTLQIMPSTAGGTLLRCRVPFSI